MCDRQHYKTYLAILNEKVEWYLKKKKNHNKKNKIQGYHNRKEAVPSLK